MSAFDGKWDGEWNGRWLGRPGPLVEGGIDGVSTLVVDATGAASGLAHAIGGGSIAIGATGTATGTPTGPPIISIVDGQVVVLDTIGGRILAADSPQNVNRVVSFGLIAGQLVAKAKPLVTTTLVVLDPIGGRVLSIERPGDMGRLVVLDPLAGKLVASNKPGQTTKVVALDPIGGKVTSATKPQAVVVSTDRTDRVISAAIN